VTAARLRAARRALTAAEASFASSAAVAQRAGTVTWTETADLLGMPSRDRTAARQWVTRHLP